MRLAGRVFRAEKHWASEVPILGLVTQGRSKRDGVAMMADAIESLVNRRGFKINAQLEKGEAFSIGSNDEAVLAAFLLRRAREKSGLSLADAAQRLGSSSRNAYARYEQGKSVPTVTTLTRLLRAISGRDFVLSEA